MADEFELNSLQRFRREAAERMTLEEYSSCEVPAGCGGVVLRWHDPDEGVPVVFHSAFQANCEAKLNGSPLHSRGVLPWSESLLTLELSEIDASLPFLFATRRDPVEEGQDAIIETGCSRSDGSWKVSTKLESGWEGIDFDDSHWAALTRSNASFPEQQSWRYEGVERDGGEPLVLPQGERLYIRTRISVSRG